MLQFAPRDGVAVQILSSIAPGAAAASAAALTGGKEGFLSQISRESEDSLDGCFSGLF